MSVTPDEYTETLLEANGAMQMGGAAHMESNTLRVGSLAPMASLTQMVPALPPCHLDRLCRLDASGKVEVAKNLRWTF